MPAYPFPFRHAAAYMHAAVHARDGESKRERERPSLFVSRFADVCSSREYEHGNGRNDENKRKCAIKGDINFLVKVKYL